MFLAIELSAEQTFVIKEDQILKAQSNSDWKVNVTNYGGASCVACSIAD